MKASTLIWIGCWLLPMGAAEAVLEAWHEEPLACEPVEARPEPVTEVDELRVQVLELHRELNTRLDRAEATYRDAVERSLQPARATAHQGTLEQVSAAIDRLRTRERQVQIRIQDTPPPAFVNLAVHEELFTIQDLLEALLTARNVHEQRALDGTPGQLTALAAALDARLQRLIAASGDPLASTSLHRDLALTEARLQDALLALTHPDADPNASF